MKPSGVILCVVFAAIALAGTVWVGRYRAQPPAILTGGAKKEIGPPISPTGPYPKVVTDETEYDFGILPIGAEGTHDFIIRNEGEADLVLMARPEDTTCSCTVGKLSEEGALKPGKSVTVTLNWKVKLPNEVFRHHAIVRTNDPERKQIELVINGHVDETIGVDPSPNWPLGEISSTEPTSTTGYVFSKVLDSFEIKSITPTKEWTKVESAPVPAEELQKRDAKSGYRLTATVSPDAPLGSYSDTVKILTSAEAVGELTFTVTGFRKGPLEFFGPQYHSEVNVLTMGEFPANQGKSMSLSVFVRDLDEDLKIEKLEQQHDSVQIALEKDEKFVGKNPRYHLKVTVPPGAPQDRQRKNAEKIDLFFNHPQARQMRLIVDFLALPAGT